MHSAFAYLTTENSRLYREIMLAFVAAKRRFTVHLRPGDVAEALGGRTGPDALARALTALEGWGNLRSDPDTSRVTTVEDFHRARFLYQLTREGEAAEEALAVYDDALGRRGALQAVALTDIAIQLRALLELSASDEPDPAKVHLSLRALVDRFVDLAANAQAFMGSLQRSIDLQEVDAEAFRAYKDQLIDYLQRFIADLVATGAEIAALVESIEEHDVGRLLDLAARREAVDAAPGGPAGSGEEDPREHEFAARAAVWRERWTGFRGWFLSTPGHPCQAKLLRSQARAAIPQLLHVVAALNERRTGRSDRSADFRSLALWFAKAPTDDDRHRLWRAAFGLSASRHLTVDADTLTAREGEPVPPGTSWTEAPPLQISPRLRRTGSYERRGRISRVVDRSEQRRHLAELAAREAAQLAAARVALSTGGPIRLGAVGELDGDAFRLFLGLLGDALGALAPGRREVSTTSSDGSMAIRLTAVADAGEIVVRTPGGEFRGPDHVVHIVDLVGDAAAERSA
ncbi:TIGR02677 family protein [Pseudonocardia sp. NPDC046786]|uniref:TIGR02677 family protein n=1 Tax=Pseudonocardia sp. NPDC046786 TaxID=3155471 RepID=UPI0033E14ED0